MRGLKLWSGLSGDRGTKMCESNIIELLKDQKLDPNYYYEENLRFLPIQVIIMNKLIALFLLILLAACNNDTSTDPPDTPPAFVPGVFSISRVKTLYHDSSYFTEGLMVYNGALYESTGNYGTSKLVKMNLQTGKTEKELPLDKKYFGEGLTILRDTIYQLTYRENTVLLYTLDFKPIKTMSFKTDSKEGWGMTTDGTNIIVSDGTSSIYYFNPADFSLIKKITVTDAGAPSHNINELEYIDGHIFANLWQYPYILKIDNNGTVIAKSDINEFWTEINGRNAEAVPNGIAYDPATKKTYLTGKYWNTIYEVEFSK